jgi:hypothetical protein
MALDMRDRCETCGTALPANGTAYICSYECTFCESCSRKRDFVCPNCSGELVPRPRRVT